MAWEAAWGHEEVGVVCSTSRPVIGRLHFHPLFFLRRSLRQSNSTPPYPIGLFLLEGDASPPKLIETTQPPTIHSLPNPCSEPDPDLPVPVGCEAESLVGVSHLQLLQQPAAKWKKPLEPSNASSRDMDTALPKLATSVSLNLTSSHLLFTFPTSESPQHPVRCEVYSQSRSSSTFHDSSLAVSSPSPQILPTLFPAFQPLLG